MNNPVPDASRRTSMRGTSAQELRGVNQTIADALSLLLVRPYLMLVPLVLDIMLWLAWHVSPVPFTRWLSGEMIANGGDEGPTVAREVVEFGERARVTDLLAALVPSVFGGVPRDSLASLVAMMVAPGITRGIDREHMFGNWETGLLTTLTPANGFGVVLLALAFLAGSTLIGVVFRIPVARSLRNETVAPGPLFRDMLECWWRLCLLAGLVAAVAVVAVIPVMLILGILYVLGINLVVLLLLGLLIFGGMAAVYTFFAVDAIFLNRAGPIQAISISYAVARQNFGPSLRFVLVSLFIASGVLRVWDVLVQNPPGIVIALLANAVLGTGLTIASMMFFQDRLRRLEPTTTRRARSAGRRWFR